MTPEEQLDEARVEEARRRWLRNDPATPDIATGAARLARENWTPPEPVVDPVLAAFLKWHASHPLASFQEAYIAGVWMARKQEQERAKGLVERVEIYAGPYDAVALAKYRGEA